MSSRTQFPGAALGLSHDAPTDNDEVAEATLRQDFVQRADPLSALALGGFLHKRGRLEEAKTVLTHVTENSAAPELLEMLAVVQYDLHAFGECETTLERLIQLAPASTLSTYQLLAKLKTARIGQAGAQDVMRRALAAHPGRTEFVAAYADTLPFDEAIAELFRHVEAVGKDPGRTAYTLLRIAARRGPELRKNHGLPSYGLSWTDTLRWPDPDYLPALKHALGAEIAAGSRRATARLELASIAASESDWGLAESFLAELREGQKRTSADFIAFGKAFHRKLDDMVHADIVSGLAEVTRIRSRGGGESGGGETVFMASDPKYFGKFTLPFLRELEIMKIPLPVHIHILDGQDHEWRDIAAALGTLNEVRATLTAEASGAASRGHAYARCYYHAVRYVRFYEELRRLAQPMWVFDCDVQLLRDPRPFLARLRDFDVALRTFPATMDPLLKMTASSVGVSPSVRGQEFARRVAAYIIHWKNRGSWGWGVDQAALFSSYAHMVDEKRMPVTFFLDDFATNEKVGDSGAIRFLPGLDKYL